jgi:excisionase family DNA binding protein
MQNQYLLTVTDVAHRLGISSESVRSYERHGKLKALKTAGGMRLFEIHEVENFARDREAKRLLEQRA